MSGFDRLVFRGTLLPLVWERGNAHFSGACGSAPAGLQAICRQHPEQLKSRSMQEALNQQPDSLRPELQG
jgi:hypothetical protein